MKRRRAAAPYAKALFELAKERGEMLSAKLGKALGSRQVVLEQIVDRAMLGGFIVDSDSIALDGSLEGQLDRMRRRLASA